MELGTKIQKERKNIVMYNTEILNNIKLLKVDVMQGEIYFINNNDHIDKRRPVVVISNQETNETGLVTCLCITSKHHHANTLPIMMNNGISFIVPYSEYTLSYKDLNTYGKRIGVLPMRVLEMLKYMKYRIYGSPKSDEHEKAIFDYSIGIFRKLLSGEFNLSKGSDIELSPETFMDGRFRKHFDNKSSSSKYNNRGGDVKIQPVSKDTDVKILEDYLSQSHDNSIDGTEIDDLPVVYTDNTAGNTQFNAMGAAIMQALETGSGKVSVDNKKKLASVNKPSKRVNKFQKNKIFSNIIEKSKEEIDGGYKEADKVINIEKPVLKPYAHVDKDGKVTVKRVTDMSMGEKSLFLLDVYNARNYTKFGDLYNMHSTSIKSRCLSCIKHLEKAGLEISADELEYFTSDQRVKNTAIS